MNINVLILYLLGITHNLSYVSAANFCRNYALSKGQTIVVKSVVRGKKKVFSVLSREIVKPDILYNTLSPYSFEAMSFFYACFDNKRVRENIKKFFSLLCHTKLKITGADLKHMDLRPHKLYSRVFKIILSRKLRNGLETKDEEIKEAIKIFRRLKREE